MRPTFGERFWSKVDKAGPAECWLWKAGKNKRTPNGYGRIAIGKGHQTAHRASWELHHGEIPKGLCVCHKCDVPTCVNPAHLFLGSPKENSHDRDAKGRQKSAKGSAHPNAILKEDQVLAIRARSTEPLPVLAREFGVTLHAIWRIRHRKNWKHL